MEKISAGILMYRFRDNFLEVFLVHNGGPFWKNKDENAWSIPKGEVKKDEDLISAAKREFEEETGIKTEGKLTYLGESKQKSGKIVYCWAFEKDWNGLLRQNFITIEWPYKSGKKIKIPEVDKVSYFSVDKAKKKIISGQAEFIDRLIENLGR
jgi:predicted NUDIX family NTP pyrophosphohydrolase